MLRISLVIFSVLVLFGCSNAATDQEHYFSGQTMGTTYNVKYVTGDPLNHEQLKQSVEQRLIDINQLMSTYIDDSELSLFNKSAPNSPYLLSQETAFVVAEALRIGALSEGSLDVTVGPLVNLWGFGPTKRPETIPTASQITQAKRLSGLDKLYLNGRELIKTVDGLYLDLSTIAKGYGVDAISQLLVDAKLDNFLVEIGGEMRVSGTKANGEAWRIAIEKPVTTERAVQRIISVGNHAVATSGDYRNYFEEADVRYSHLIDPNTGYPIQHKTVSATIVHPSSMTADGLATAMMVLSPEKAKALAEKENLALLLVFKEGDGFFEYQSPTFQQIVTIIN